MKAVLIRQPGTVELVDLPKPELEDDHDVIVRVRSGGICGSDVGIYLGTNALATYPRIIGHEFGGIVEAVGSAVSALAVGDQVAIDPTTVSATDSYAIRRGRYNVDHSLRVMGVHRDGGFAEYVRVPAQNAHRVSTTIAPELLALVEPYSIGYQVCQRAEVGAGERMLVMGAGPIGSCIMQIAKGRGARVIIADRVPERLARARAAGADATVNMAEESLATRLLDFTDGEGIELIADAICRPETFISAIELAAPAGRIVCLSTAADLCPIPASEITKKELTIYGSRLTNNGFPPVIAAFEAGELDPSQLVSQRFPLAEIEQALRLVIEEPENTLKVMLDL